MPRIMIICPIKNVPVSTGMGSDQQSFDSSDYSGNSFQCSACGQMHTWSKKDAFLEKAQ